MHGQSWIPKDGNPLVVHKEGGFSREKNCVLRTEKLDMKDVIGSPSDAILHGKIA